MGGYFIVFIFLFLFSNFHLKFFYLKYKKFLNKNIRKQFSVLFKKHKSIKDIKKFRKLNGYISDWIYYFKTKLKIFILNYPLLVFCLNFSRFVKVKPWNLLKFFYFIYNNKLLKFFSLMRKTLKALFVKYNFDLNLYDYVEENLFLLENRFLLRNVFLWYKNVVCLSFIGKDIQIIVADFFSHLIKFFENNLWKSISSSIFFFKNHKMWYKLFWVNFFGGRDFFFSYKRSYNYYNFLLFKKKKKFFFLSVLFWLFIFLIKLHLSID